MTRKLINELKIIVYLFILFPVYLFAAPFCPYQDCPSNDWCAYPRSDFKVDNACVDFCLDYEHSLSECQKSCTN